MNRVNLHYSNFPSFTVALILLLPSCGLQTPSVPNRSMFGAKLDHAAFTSNCSSCHEVHRPAPKNGVAHGSGLDCAKCHSYQGGWTGGVVAFTHNPMPTSCTSCHENKRPAPVSGIPHGLGMDCVSCHTPTTWKAAVSYTHSPTLTSCNTCHAPYRPTSGARNINFANSAPFHQTGLYDGSHYCGKDCASCHRTPQNGGAGWGFNHRNFQSQNVGFCLSCHFTDGWNKHAGQNYFVDYGTCFNCHNVNVKSWDR